MSLAKYVKKMKTERIILGIDPGTRVMGFGMIAVTGSELKLLVMDELMLSKYDSHSLRLTKIFERTLGLIDEIPSGRIGSRGAFFPGKNRFHPLLKLRVGAQGVAMGSRDFYRGISHYRNTLPKKSRMGDYRATEIGQQRTKVAAMLATDYWTISVLPTKLDRDGRVGGRRFVIISTPENRMEEKIRVVGTKCYFR